MRGFPAAQRSTTFFSVSGKQPQSLAVAQRDVPRLIVGIESYP